jgi:hypothetical protein
LHTLRSRSCTSRARPTHERLSNIISKF